MSDYTCDACGVRTHAAQARGEWLALRIAGDRRGLEIRRFEHSGPDDRYVCGQACAFRRISEMLGDMPQAVTPAAADRRWREQPGAASSAPYDPEGKKTG